MSLRRNRNKNKSVDDSLLIDDDAGPELIYQKIKAPIIWDELTINDKEFIIKDAKEENFQEMLDLTYVSLLFYNVLGVSINIIDDPESCEAYLDNIRNILKDGSSLVLVEKETNKCVGCLILKVYPKSDFGKVYSRVKLRNGVKFQQILDITHYLDRRIDLYEMYKVKIYLRIYTIVIDPNYIANETYTGLIRSTYRLARTMKISLIMGIVSNMITQNQFKKFGMKILLEQFYVDWRKKDGSLIFENLGPGNYTLALIVGKVSKNFQAPVSDPSLTKFPSDDEEDTVHSEEVPIDIGDVSELIKIDSTII